MAHCIQHVRTWLRLRIACRREESNVLPSLVLPAHDKYKQYNDAHAATILNGRTGPETCSIS